MNTKISVSFGVSIILIGILCIFLDINEMVMVGISLSALSFSILNLLYLIIKNNKLKRNYDYLYLISFFVLLLFSCFNDSLLKIDLFKFMLNDKVSNFITVISFGLLFVSEFLTYRQKNKDYRKIFENNLQYDLNFNDSLIKLLSNNMNNNDLFYEITSALKLKITETKKKYEIISSGKDEFNLVDAESIVASCFLEISNDENSIKKEHN